LNEAQIRKYIRDQQNFDKQQLELEFT